MRAYKVDPSASTEKAEPAADGGGSTSAGGVAGSSDGNRSSSSGSVAGAGAKADAGGELFKVDLDPTGMYAAACSFDKVCPTSYT